MCVAPGDCVCNTCTCYRYLFLDLREIGFLIHLSSSHAASLAVAGGDFGRGVGPTNVNGLRCIGNESTLLDCPVRPTFGTIFCTHYDDAGVLCPRVLTLTQHLPPTHLQNASLYVCITSSSYPLPYVAPTIYVLLCTT